MPKTTTVLVLPADGSKPRLETVTESVRLAEFQRLVGGYIELVHPRHIPMHNGTVFTMVVNEDGLNLGLPLNSRGTVIYAGPGPAPSPIVGDVLIMGQKRVGLAEVWVDYDHDWMMQYIPGDGPE